MRLIELNEKIHNAYENAMRTVANEETMAISYGTREAALLLLRELGKVYVSCTQDERPLREIGGNYFMGIAEDWRDLYESVHDHTVDEARVDDPLATAVFAVAELAYALLAK